MSVFSSSSSRRVSRRSRGSAAVQGRSHLFWLLAVFLVLLALTGGGSRPDILSLAIVWPAAIMVAAVAAWTVTAADLARVRFALLLLGAVFVLVLAHLVPLPPAWWQALPGRHLVTAIDRQAGLEDVWRPLSLVPSATRSALFSLFVPLAVLLVGGQLDRSALERLLLVILMVALFDAVLALLQLLAPPTSPLFLYDHTNYDSATGLFANRNHQAILLAITLPMLVVATTMRAGTRQATAIRWGALLVAAFLIPLLLVTGSRAGLVLGLVAGASSLLLIRRRSTGRSLGNYASVSRRRQMLLDPRVLGAAGIMLLIGLTLSAERAVSVERLFGNDSNAELRFKVWPVIIDAIPTYLPMGSGIGSFERVFQITEPDAILRPTYLNHAHSEPLEILLTAGIPGFVLLLVAVVGWSVAAWQTLRVPVGSGSSVLFARLGVIVIALLALGSVADYPVRTPFLAALLTLSTLWASRINDQSAT
jgi:O-antigen ligase